MVRVASAAAAMAAAALAAQACRAAPLQAGPFDRGPSAFAGIHLRVPLGVDEGRPQVRLQLASGFSMRDARTGATETFRSDGLEVGLGRSGKPALYLNGQSSRDLPVKLGVKGSTGTTLLIVGGVLVVLVLVAAAAGGAGFGDTCPTVGGSRAHCTNP
jgi:hypothetical protein